MSISCKNLAVSQTVGCQPPDPVAALYVADSRGHWEQVSRTETVHNTRGKASKGSSAYSLSCPSRPATLMMLLSLNVTSRRSEHLQSLCRP